MSLANLRILVADDNANMRAVIRTLLQGLGCHKVVEANDGADALEVMRSAPVDIAIVDLLMDPLDGLDFIRLVRTSTDSVDPHLPIIVLSAHSDRARVTQARDAGANEVMVKPVSANSLALRLNSIIRNPRAFVRSSGYTGPDRRRKQDPRYTGTMRRATDKK
jgi:two-component system, chemotaxis family, chemotaxis protein CheY